MKVSKVIARLNELQKEVGDVECDLIITQCDGTDTGIDDINEIDISTEPDGDKGIYIAHLVENEDKGEEEN